MTIYAQNEDTNSANFCPMRHSLDHAHNEQGSTTGQKTGPESSEPKHEKSHL